MAIVSVIALFVALALVALISLQPWATDSVAPELRIAPGLEGALGEAVPLSRDDGLALASAHPAVADTGTGGTQFVADGTAGGVGAPRSQPAVADARPVVDLAPAARPEGPPEAPAPEPLPATPQPSSPPPAAVPVAAPTPPPAEPVAAVPTVIPARGGSMSGPVGAGTGVAEGEAGEVPEGSGDDGVEAPDAGEGTFPCDTAGERLLVLLPDGVWHPAIVCFEVAGGGMYVLILDGQADPRNPVSPIDPEAEADESLEPALP